MKNTLFKKFLEDISLSYYEKTTFSQSKFNFYLENLDFKSLHNKQESFLGTIVAYYKYLNIEVTAHQWNNIIEKTNVPKYPGQDMFNIMKLCINHGYYILNEENWKNLTNKFLQYEQYIENTCVHLNNYPMYIDKVFNYTEHKEKFYIYARENNLQNILQSPEIEAFLIRKEREKLATIIENNKDHMKTLKI